MIHICMEAATACPFHEVRALLRYKELYHGISLLSVLLPPSELHHFFTQACIIRSMTSLRMACSVERWASWQSRLPRLQARRPLTSLPSQSPTLSHPNLSPHQSLSPHLPSGESLRTQTLLHRCLLLASKTLAVRNASLGPTWEEAGATALKPTKRVQNMLQYE
jgi:hypothetical protein